MKKKITLNKQTLSHVDEHGRARMVDVSGKTATCRRATVEGFLHISQAALHALKNKNLKKGDPFTVAKLAGILAAKRTADLIPLCHPLPIEHVDVSFELLSSTRRIRACAQTTTTAKTGIELEAFTAVSLALLTLYDMIKAVDPAACITGIRLVQKTGGKSTFKRPA